MPSDGICLKVILPLLNFMSNFSLQSSEFVSFLNPATTIYTGVRLSGCGDFPTELSVNCDLIIF
jgi:hypothetical protein